MVRMDQALVRRHDGSFHWEGVDVLQYKQEGAAPFKDVTRQVLFEMRDLPAQLRYFEVAPGGYTTLERHQPRARRDGDPRPRRMPRGRQGLRDRHA
jgi:hypothetical protein